jgi:hypothetical protein
MSTVKFDTWENAAGTREFQGVHTWVHFDGTGTVSIIESTNVSSITDNGTGDYTVNFTTALTNTNYGMVGSCGATDSAGNGARWISDGAGSTYGNTKTTSALLIHTVYATTSWWDCDRVSVGIIGGI